MRQLLIPFFAIVLFANCNNNKGWSLVDQQKATKMCLDKTGGNLDEKDAKKLCSCLLTKAMNQYPSLDAADKGISDEEGAKMTQACMKDGALGGNNEANGGDEEAGGKKKGGGLFGGGDDKKIDNGEDNVDSGWSSADKRKYMNECVPSATNTGVDQETATSYCNCTLEKMQKKFKSYSDAQKRLTNEVLTTIQQACAQMHQGGNDQ